MSSSKRRHVPNCPSPKFTASLLDANTACVNMEVEVEANPDALFALLADPDKHTAIFDAIEGASCRLLEEKGSWRKYELDYRARWRFWKVSGVCDNLLYMETDSDAGTVSFKLREPGFLRVYEGLWRITPAESKTLGLYSRLSTTSKHPSLPAMRHLPPGLRSHPVHLLRHPSSDSSSSSPRSSLDTSLSATHNTSGADGLFGPSISSFLASIAALNPLGGLCSKISFLQALNTTSLMPPSPFSQEDPASAYMSTTLHPVHNTSTPLPTGGRFTRSKVTVHRLLMSPKVSPPYPLNQILKGHATGQVHDMLMGLLEAAQKLTPEEVCTVTNAAVTASSQPTSTHSTAKTAAAPQHPSTKAMHNRGGSMVPSSLIESQGMADDSSISISSQDTDLGSLNIHGSPCVSLFSQMFSRHKKVTISSHTIEIGEELTSDDDR